MSKFRFSVGPCNIQTGADSYGPAVRDEISFEEKIKEALRSVFNQVKVLKENGYEDKSGEQNIVCPPCLDWRNI